MIDAIFPCSYILYGNSIVGILYPSGIGGGELMGPLLLRLKVLPEVSSSTVPVMSLLNTSSSVIHYMTIDEYPYEYATGMFIIGTERSFLLHLWRHILTKWLLSYRGDGWCHWKIFSSSSRSFDRQTVVACFLPSRCVDLISGAFRIRTGLGSQWLVVWLLLLVFSHWKSLFSPPLNFQVHIIIQFLLIHVKVTFIYNFSWL